VTVDEDRTSKKIPWYYTDVFLGLVAVAVAVAIMWWSSMHAVPLRVSLPPGLLLLLVGFFLLLRQRENNQGKVKVFKHWTEGISVTGVVAIILGVIFTIAIIAVPEAPRVLLMAGIGVTLLGILFVWLGARYGPSPNPASEPPTEQVIAISERFAEMTALPCVNLEAVRRDAAIWDSKFGGTPYLPPGFDYPRDKTPGGSNAPLKLLAQLNFATLPKPDWGTGQAFPTSGILQFCIACTEDDDVYGADFDDPTAQNGFRVVYHADVIEDASQLQQPPELPSDPMFPFEGEFGLDATIASMPITGDDFRFDDVFKASFQDIPADEMDETLDAVRDYFIDKYPGTGHRIGGYPYFVQEDPRPYPDDGRKAFTQMLLQIDSDVTIMWGDVGVANFFVRPVSGLASLDLSTAMYTWDCS